MHLRPWSGPWCWLFHMPESANRFFRYLGNLLLTLLAWGIHLAIGLPFGSISRPLPPPGWFAGLPSCSSAQARAVRAKPGVRPAAELHALRGGGPRFGGPRFGGARGAPAGPGCHRNRSIRVESWRNMALQWNIDQGFGCRTRDRGADKLVILESQNCCWPSANHLRGFFWEHHDWPTLHWHRSFGLLVMA